MEASHIDFDSIPAPWPRLLNIENSTAWLQRRFDDNVEARGRLHAFNENAIEKLLTKTGNEEKHQRKLLAKMHKHHETAALRSKAENCLEKIRHSYAETQTTILTLNQYGTHAHHINLHLALEEAQQLLTDITTLTTQGENARKSLVAANTLLQYWSSMSQITTDQVVEASELTNYGVMLKNRLQDSIQLAHRAFDTLTKAESTLSYNRRRYEALLQQHKRIFELQSGIRDIYNTSIVAQTDTAFEIIDDNHGKIQQDMENLQRLQQIVRDVNEECAEGLHVIRTNYKDAAQRQAHELTLRAKKYAQLFQHSRNGAEVALLASSAHRNISGAIDSARILAAEAIEAVAKSEEELFIGKGESVIEKGLQSLRRSQKIEEDAIKEMNKMHGEYQIIIPLGYVLLENNNNNNDREMCESKQFMGNVHESCILFFIFHLRTNTNRASANIIIIAEE